MKVPFKPCLVCVTLLMGATSHGQTFEWGSPNGIEIVDSYGVVLNDTYIFELGSFANSFVPTTSNVSDWFTNWRTFDRADYNELDEIFTGTVDMLPNGTSDSPFLTSGATSFEGLNAYIWVRNSDVPSATTEWFLARADSWVFPNYDPNCCGGNPIQWSLSDLDENYSPVFGSQGTEQGGGVRNASGTFELQTHTFVPEPSSVMLAFFGAGLLFIRRRND